MSTSSWVVLGCEVLLLSLAGCNRGDPVTGTPAPRAIGEKSDVLAGPVRGSLEGRPFQAKTARYSVDHRPGFERLEVQLLDHGSETPCENHRADKPNSVWLRRSGADPIEPGSHRIPSKAKGAWEVHYETFLDGKWRGNGAANARLVLDEVRVDGRLDGELEACFGDREQSCVKGTFEATYCPIVIDAPVRGAQAMEPNEPSSTGTREPEEIRLGSDASPIAIEPRQQLLPTYPCSRCHDSLERRPKKYRLTKFHSVRNDEFSHGEDEFWCYQCHSLGDIDRLRTATGKEVTFNEAYRICTSCHGDKLEDWRVGVHGQVLGNYNGKKFKKSCPACHDPHNPRFPLMKPLPPPAPPREWHTL